MGHYIANLRDIEFCLFDLLGRDQILGKGLFSDIDTDTAKGMLEEMKRLSENEIAASFVDGDRLGVEFDPKTGEGKVPESFKKSYRQDFWMKLTLIPICNSIINVTSP